MFKRIVGALQPDVTPYQRGRETMVNSQWEAVRDQAHGVLGVLHSREEVEANLQPSGPRLQAAALHPMGWQTAQPLLVAGFPDQAVAVASTAVESMIKGKTARQDVSGSVLMTETFKLDPPAAGKP